MRADRASSSDEEFTSETLTDEIIASYVEQGFTLVFAEDVMRYDLSRAVPEIAAPPTTISYRTWDAEHSHAFFTVYDAAFRERPGFPGWSEAEWVRWVSDDPAFRPDLSYLAVAQGQAVGFITTGEDEQAPERHGYIIQVGVLPQWRGEGIGAALVARALAAWRDERKDGVLLHVNSNNPTARRLYERLGFSVVGRRGTMRMLSPVTEEDAKRSHRDLE